MMAADLVTGGTLVGAIVKPELYRNPGKSFNHRRPWGQGELFRVRRTAKIPGCLQLPKSETRLLRSECSFVPRVPDELFRPRPSAPPGRGRCRLSRLARGRLQTAVSPAQRFAGHAVRRQSPEKPQRSPQAKPGLRK